MQVVRTETEIRNELEIIVSDDLLKMPKQTLEINAPVALMQLVLETKRDALKWVLRERKGI